MSKAIAILMTMFTAFILVVGPISGSFADQPAGTVEVKNEESKGIWGWIKDKVMWAGTEVKNGAVYVGTAVKDGAVYVGSAIGNGFKSAWNWIWPSNDKKKDEGMKASTTPTMKMGIATSPL